MPAGCLNICDSGLYRSVWLLALGAGSSRRRYRGVLIGLHVDGSVHCKAKIVDASPWLDELTSRLGELSIEGGWVSGHPIHLLQRGNKGRGVNAVASSDLVEQIG